ncbi:MAG: hypothetical protein ACLRSA_06215 [Streptococcus salivarius]
MIERLGFLVDDGKANEGHQAVAALESSSDLMPNVEESKPN